ncbi:hypothetical protein ANCDUO_12453 [Ancylostoma duodenale]|uniref:Uncharacterized protein n=1 Tax=Ancylostoma duodenale TaxID=51022 RepID=A0A0C2CLF6_9BILA|nr:hypothetical protein ANCDUO_12453 [Ancylostoma duodenale]
MEVCSGSESALEKHDKLRSLSSRGRRLQAAPSAVVFLRPQCGGPIELARKRGVELWGDEDVTLVILLVSAIVSLALSFYRPPDDGTGHSLDFAKATVAVGEFPWHFEGHKMVLADVVKLALGHNFWLVTWLARLTLIFVGKWS